jgi:hypothetical protein
MAICWAAYTVFTQLCRAGFVSTKCYNEFSGRRYERGGKRERGEDGRRRRAEERGDLYSLRNHYH